MTRAEKLALAGDYVLGLLDPGAAETFERECLADPELAGMATHLTERMAALDDTAPSATYSADLWPRIEAAVHAASQARTASVAPRAKSSRQKALPHWLPLAASVVLALGIGYLAGRSMGEPSAPTMIAVLLNESDASPAVIVEAFADDSIHLVPLDRFAAPEGQVLQIWTLPDPATGPVSLGTLNASQDIRLSGPDLALPQSGQLYEITLEPAPGSPTGRPTGPILVKGFAKAPTN